MTALAAALAGGLGLLAGTLVNRAAGRYPWPPPERSWSRRGRVPAEVGVAPRRRDGRRERGSGARVAVRTPLLEFGTAVLFALVGLRFGPSWELPAFLLLAGSGVLLAVIDLQHRLLPNRIVLPSLGIGAALLALAAAVDENWEALFRAGLGAAALFAVFLVLALISPRSLGMGDVKLAGLVGLYLGWFGWGAVVVGALAGFVVQALIALVLLATRRIGLGGELPFGPAMLLGAALAIGWSDALLR